MPNYDPNNICEILRGEIPNKTVYEDDYVLAFWDIGLKRKPMFKLYQKAAYINMTDLARNGSDEDI